MTREYVNGFCIISSLEIVIYSKCVSFALRKKIINIRYRTKNIIALLNVIISVVTKFIIIIYRCIQLDWLLTYTYLFTSSGEIDELHLLSDLLCMPRTTTAAEKRMLINLYIHRISIGHNIHYTCIGLFCALHHVSINA